jgi:hypothetical protein
MKLYVKGSRLAWAESLFTPETSDQPNAKPKFQSRFIIEATTLGFVGDANPESGTGRTAGYRYGDFKEQLSKGILAVATKAFGAQTPNILAQLKETKRLILHSGVEVGNKRGYEGNHYFNAGSKYRPVLLKNGAPIVETDGTLYPGCYVDVVCDLWAGPSYNKAPMVGVTLLGVVFNRDSERLAGGAMAAEDDFAPVAPEAQAKAETSGAGAASLF